MRATRTLAILAVIPLLALATGCGNGGGGGSASSDPNAPIIANLRVTFGNACLLAPGTGGTIMVVAFDFADADGNVSGGVLEAQGTAPSGQVIPIQSAIPSRVVTISGTTSGTISIGICIRFGGNPSITLQGRITDASGKVSNTLTLAVANPGLILRPRDSDPALRMVPLGGN